METPLPNFWIRHCGPLGTWARKEKSIIIFIMSNECGKWSTQHGKWSHNLFQASCLTLGWNGIPIIAQINTWLAEVLLRSTIQAIRGARSSRGHAVAPHIAAMDLITSESRLNDDHWTVSMTICLHALFSVPHVSIPYLDFTESSTELLCYHSSTVLRQQ